MQEGNAPGSVPRYSALQSRAVSAERRDNRQIPDLVAGSTHSPLPSDTPRTQQTAQSSCTHIPIAR
eukprot:5180297-Prymnesium_polylepis.2